MVINLIAGVKMPFPENLRNNLARTERVQLDTNAATVACLRLDDKIRWCYEHIAPLGARAEMLRIRNEPVPGLLVGQAFHYVDDFDLDGSMVLGYIAFGGSMFGAVYLLLHDKPIESLAAFIVALGSAFGPKIYVDFIQPKSAEVPVKS